MNARNLFVILIVIYLGFTSAFAEENDISALNQRVIRLEGQKELLDGQKKNLEDTYNTKLGILDRQLEQNKKEIADKITDMESYRKAIDDKLVLEFQKTDFRVSKLEWILGFLGLITIGGLIGLAIGWYKLNKKILEIADEKAATIFEEKFKNRIEQLFQDHKDEIIRVVGEEIQLRNTKSIVVVSKSGTEEQERFLRQFFEKMKFKKENISFDSFDLNKKYDDKDLVLMNIDAGGFSEAEITEFAKSVTHSMLFLFGKGRYDLDKLGDKCASTNFKSQLYGNLMNALRYQKML